ncbi:MAG: hypothetical protein ABI128_07880 [Rhodanobacter sp.]
MEHGAPPIAQPPVLGINVNGDGSFRPTPVIQVPDLAARNRSFETWIALASISSEIMPLLWDTRVEGKVNPSPIPARYLD